MASVHVSSRYCSTCKAVRRCERQRANHLLHLLLAIITMGLWLPIWVLCSFSGAYHCKDCGRVVSSLIDKIALGVLAAILLVILVIGGVTMLGS